MYVLVSTYVYVSAKQKKKIKGKKKSERSLLSKDDSVLPASGFFCTSPKHGKKKWEIEKSKKFEKNKEDEQEKRKYNDETQQY